MKVKQLKWVDHESQREWYVSYSDKSTPQIAYFIRSDWDMELNIPCKRLEFSHGYVECPTIVGKFKTVDRCKDEAQKHFEKYVTDSFLEAVDLTSGYTHIKGVVKM